MDLILDIIYGTLIIAAGTIGFILLMIAITTQEARQKANESFREHFHAQCNTCDSPIMDYDNMIECRKCGNLICESCAHGPNPDGDICGPCIKGDEALLDDIKYYISLYIKDNKMTEEEVNSITYQEIIDIMKHAIYNQYNVTSHEQELFEELLNEEGIVKIFKEGYNV